MEAETDMNLIELKKEIAAIRQDEDLSDDDKDAIIAMLIERAAKAGGPVFNGEMEVTD